MLTSDSITLTKPTIDQCPNRWRTSPNYLLPLTASRPQNPPLSNTNSDPLKGSSGPGSLTSLTYGEAAYQSTAIMLLTILCMILLCALFIISFLYTRLLQRIHSTDSHSIGQGIEGKETRHMAAMGSGTGEHSGEEPLHMQPIVYRPLQGDDDPEG